MTEENISASENSYEIESLADFSKALKKIEKPKEGENQENTTRFFRGHADKDFELIPSIYRNNGFIKNEDKIIQETLVHRPDYFASNDTLFEKLVKLQHYGYPTRLLDLTSNPLVALYFAVESESHKDKDGEVIILDIPNSKIRYESSGLVSVLSAISIRESDFCPKKYHNICEKFAREQQILMEINLTNIRNFVNLNPKSTYKDYVEKNMTEQHIERGLKNIFNDTYVKCLNNAPDIVKLLNDIRIDRPGFTSSIFPDDFYKIVCVQAKLNNPRIERQQGSFLLFGISEEGKMKPASINNSKDIKINRIVVPGKYKEDIRKELEVFGISKRSLFPELADQAEFIKEKYGKK